MQNLNEEVLKDIENKTFKAIQSETMKLNTKENDLMNKLNGES